jgi:hypothetical protein
MFTHGLTWEKSFMRLFGRIENLIDGFDFLSSRRPSWGLTLRVLIGSVPAVLASVIPIKIAPVLVLFTLVSLYAAVRPVYDVLLNENLTELFCFVMTPLHVIVFLWVLLLMLSDRVFQISRIAGPVALVLIIILWPVYSKAAKSRRTPLGWRYGIACAFVVLQQAIFLIEK